MNMNTRIPKSTYIKIKKSIVKHLIQSRKNMNNMKIRKKIDEEVTNLLNKNSDY